MGGWSFYSEGSHIDGTLGLAPLFEIYATPLPVPVLYPIHLTNVTVLSDGSFQFGFTNSPGFSFTTYATTDAAVPATDWLNSGNPVNIISNYYQYNSGPGIVNNPKYPTILFRVTSP